MTSRRLLTAFPAVLAVFLLGGCHTNPLDIEARFDGALTAKASGSLAGFGSGDFYPLAIGNTWDYERHLHVEFFPDDGSSVPSDDYESTEHHAITGTEVRDGRDYFIREETITEEGSVGLTAYTRLRQDRSGLFGANVNSFDPPSAVPAATSAGMAQAIPLNRATLRARGASEASIERFAERIASIRTALRGGAGTAARPAENDELIFLLYPLRVGLEWSVRPDFPWPVRVAGKEILETEAGHLAAYRLDVTPFGTPHLPGEFAKLWYGRPGFLGYSLRLSSDMTDENGNPIGKAVYEETLLITAMSQGT